LRGENADAGKPIYWGFTNNVPGRTPRKGGVVGKVTLGQLRIRGRAKALKGE